MTTHLWTAFRVAVVTIAIFGIAYPLAIWGVSQAVFPYQARGSVVAVGGHVVGSSIVGQEWTRARDFQGRPSAAGKNGYDPTATGGSNLGPDSSTLIARIRATVKALRQRDPSVTGPPPNNLVTASGSGIDPDISPAAALYQSARVARARHLPLRTVRRLVAAHTTDRTLGILGEPRVNVLLLNLALDRLR